VIAVGFGLIGLFYNPFLVFVALFVWMGASGEASMVQIKSALGGIPVSRAMITDFRTLSPSAALQQAVDLVLVGFQQDFPIVDDRRLVGMLTRADLLKQLARRGPQAPVAHAMSIRFEAADPTEMLEVALARLRGCECQSIPVVRGGAVVGVLTLENVGELVMIQSALGSGHVVSAAA
jgi:CBS domain-containing protein